MGGFIWILESAGEWLNTSKAASRSSQLSGSNDSRIRASVIGISSVIVFRYRFDSIGLDCFDCAEFGGGQAAQAESPRQTGIGYIDIAD